MSVRTTKGKCPFRAEKVEATRTIGDHSYPTRGDYEREYVRAGLAGRPREVWQSEDLVVRAQRHWHNSGQNGCVFAQWIAKRASSRAWAALVDTTDTPANLCTGAIGLIDDEIQRSIADPECEVLSLLFPRVTTDRDLVGLLDRILDVPAIRLTHTTEYGPYAALAMRVELPSTGAESWLMGFGPYWFLPRTRQAPSTEIAIRVKPKPDQQFHRLNQDPHAAHLADYPADMKESSWEAIWNATLRNTREVLGTEPDEISAAKVTFPVPALIWNEVHLR